MWFSYVDAFGFSMGGLALRSYQAVRLPDLPIRSMVTMATPHHGALQLAHVALVGGLSVTTGFHAALLAQDTLELWSPGTADLLDYSETFCDKGLAELSLNRTLCRLNENRRSAPERGLAVIAGTDSQIHSELLDNALGVSDMPKLRDLVDRMTGGHLSADILDAIDRVFTLGFALTACLESDSVVCVWSAHANRAGSGAQVTALQGWLDRRPAEEDFNHFQGGKPSQPITPYRDLEVVPSLSDWVVGKTIEEPRVTKKPTATEAGEFEIPMSVQFNVHHGDVVGVVRVVYGGYMNAAGQLEWRILDGADAEGRPEEIVETKRNSVGQSTVEIRRVVAIPRFNAADRTTHITILAGAIVPIGPTQPTVPLEPVGGFFADVDGL